MPWGSARRSHTTRRSTTNTLVLRSERKPSVSKERTKKGEGRGKKKKMKLAPLLRIGRSFSWTHAVKSAIAHWAPRWVNEEKAAEGGK